MAVFLHRHVFSNSVFFVLNSLTANIQFLKIQLQVFKMKKKFGTSNSIFKIQRAEIQIVQKVGQRSSEKLNEAFTATVRGHVRFT